MSEVPDTDTVGSIDLLVVDELRAELDDEELLVELVCIFLEDSGRRIDVMVQAAGRQDVVLMRSAAHALKGSGGTFGARRLSELCSDLEHGDSGHEPAVLVERIVLEHDAVRDTLHHLLQQG